MIVFNPNYNNKNFIWDFITKINFLQRLQSLSRSSRFTAISVLHWRVVMDVG